jgi:peptidoglycan hydrolase-like protein with peptidoglycan-binding domain
MLKHLQQFLKDEGYYYGKIDGKYGRISARAVKDFQEDNDLVVTQSAAPGCQHDSSSYHS